MTNKNHYKYIILGAGPAGLQLGYYLQKQGVDYKILEGAKKAGATFDIFPRHRTLISINKRFTGCDDPEFNMRHDWNSLITDDFKLSFRNYDKEFFPSADNLVRYMGDFATEYQLNIQYDTFVEGVSKVDGQYQLRDQNGNDHSADVLIVATGFIKPFIPNIKGIELTENYVDVSTDTEAFENKRVLIIGKGNSAFETADHLVSSAAMIHLVSPNSIRMAWKTHYVGDLRAVNNNLLDTYQLKSQNAALDAVVDKIEKNDDGFTVTFKYEHAQDEVEVIKYDRVICCTGFRFDDSIYDDSCKPALMIKNKYPQITSSFESVNNDNLYFTGTISHGLDYKKATSGFIHGFRYNAKALGYILATKYEGQQLPVETQAYDAQQLTGKVLGRLNRSGGLWQQPGYIADYFYYTGQDIVYGKELPLAYAVENLSKNQQNFFTIALEYGQPIVGDPFNVERIHKDNTSEAQNSQFLHPIIRQYVAGVCVNEHHVIEDLEANWVEDIHFDPLQTFLEHCIEPEKLVKTAQHNKDIVM